MKVGDVVTLVAAAGAIVAVAVGAPTWVVWGTRIAVILLLLLLAAAGSPGRYRTFVLLGLLASAVGDLIFLVPADLFLAGVACFLVAHVCYIAAFTPGVGRHGASIARLVYFTLGAAMLAALWRGLDPLYRVALSVYGLVLIVMAGQAAARWGKLKTAAARSAGIGAAFFLLSDGMLALDRFRVQFPGARVAILVTYYLAQWLIARSTDEGTSV
ncbi:MAG TPA: lysoplasmalogenase [Gemmatimonadales bacterium]|nr:lysoplasmalogenase [Gemmatimonadales bacterium]